MSSLTLPVRLKLPLASGTDASQSSKNNAGGPAPSFAWSPVVLVAGGRGALHRIHSILKQVKDTSAPIIDLVCSERHLKCKLLAQLVESDQRVRWLRITAGSLAQRLSEDLNDNLGSAKPLVIVQADYGHQFDRDEWLAKDKVVGILGLEPGSDNVLLDDTDGIPGHVAVGRVCRNLGLLVHVWGFPELSDFAFDDEVEPSDETEGGLHERSTTLLSTSSVDTDDTCTLRSPSPAISTTSPTSSPLSLPLELINALTPSSHGTLSLVGSGPGHPAHLTLLALSTLHSADTIITDRLVSPQIMDLVLSLSTRSPEVKTAGKHCGRAHLAQEEIYRWTQDALGRGQNVVRLKSGDPFVFGRGGEEYLHFSRLGHPVRVIPGLSSALSAPLAGLVPVTHRRVADQVLIATGVREDGTMPSSFPPYTESRTCVFLMAMGKLEELTKVLKEKCGFPGDIGAAVIEKATWGSDGFEQEALDRLLGIFGTTVKSGAREQGVQRVVRARLDGLVKAVREKGITNHAVLVVGRVVDVLGVGVEEM